MRESGIYRIRNTINGKFYVGQAENLPRRWILHRSDLRGNRHSNRHLQAAWNKYGEYAFTFEVIVYCPIGELDEWEQVLLHRYVGTPDCYNLALYTDNPMRGRKHTQERIARMSEDKKGDKNGMFGKTHSPETRRKIALKTIGSKRRLGAVLSEETRMKISQSLIGKAKGANNPRNKITHEIVAMVYLLSSQGVYQYDIGIALGISQTTVSKINRGVTYLQEANE